MMEMLGRGVTHRDGLKAFDGSRFYWHEGCVKANTLQKEVI
jgi:hypothetical protein